MKPRCLLRELEHVAEAVELSVRTQPFRRSTLNAGGLCKLRGKEVVLLNSRCREDERALVLAEVLAHLDTSQVAMSEGVREFLTRRSGRRPGAVPGRLDAAGPGLHRARPKHKRH